jgi:signal transduction histidine kinase
VDLLNTVSRLHRFHLHCETTREKIAGKVRDLVLLLFYLGENGVDATPEGGEIHLSITSLDQHQVVFTFADKGPGFAPVQAAAFGKPFNTHQDPAPGAASAFTPPPFSPPAMAAPWPAAARATLPWSAPPSRS